MYSYELEKQLLAGLIKDPNSLVEISNFISTSDFYSESTSLNSTIFRIIEQAINASDEIDEIIIAQRVNEIGLSFEDNVNPSDYIKSLALRKVPEGNILKTAKELKKYSIRREIYNSSQTIAKRMKAISAESSYQDIIQAADTIYNSKINLYEMGSDVPLNIYDDMESIIEERGNNPVTEFGMLGPHQKLNEIYGSLLRPGNITVVVARSGVGKTQFCMDFCTKVSAANEHIPILHFDNGEMSKEELRGRQCAALSKIPVHLLETGLWRQAGEDIVKRVRAVWKKIKDMKFFYYNVAGMSSEDMINLLKRFYFSEVGRGKQMIFSFDYIKTTSESNDKNRSEWELVGNMVQRFKDCIHRDIKFDGEPVISMITSVQSNRQGIVNNRRAENIVDDESIFSLSDRIVQFASHAFILRKKTEDEMEQEPNFGTHKFKCVKYRHLGQDVNGAVNPVRMPDGGLQQNYIHLDFNNFHITEKGDLRDLVAYLERNPEIIEDGN